MSLKSPTFLTLAEAVEIHKDQIKRYGGSKGIRDLHLLQSALAQPEASFSGEWLHGDLFEMASAYAFHIAENQPFFDGNKRTGLASALVFLELNGVSVVDPKQKLLRVMLGIAKKKLWKQNLAAVFKELSQ